MARASLVSVNVRYNYLNAIRTAFPKEIDAILAKATADVYKISQTTVPVDKTNLKQSGQQNYDSGSQTGEVSYNIYYAVYVHEGTVKMAARPFLKNALAKVSPAVNAAFAQLESRLPGG